MGSVVQLFAAEPPVNALDNAVAVAISRAHGLSPAAAAFLVDLAGVVEMKISDPTVGYDVCDCDGEGREWILWLSHRGLVVLEDSMGILYFRISPQGLRVVRDAGKAAV